MKINWKILVTLVLMIAAGVWMFDSVRTRYYTGNDLRFAVGSGRVTVDNPSSEPAPAQLVGTGSRTFTVSRAGEGTLGTSSRQGSGRDISQVFEFTVPSGSSVFTVVRGQNVNFVANTSAGLNASVEPLSAGETQTTMLAAGAVILGGLFYIYTTWRQSQRDALRRQEIADRAAQPVSASAAKSANLGRDGRAYSDS